MTNVIIQCNVLCNTLCICTCRKGTDVGDHPPITPMKAATEGELGHDMWRIYEYITRHFIGTVSGAFNVLTRELVKVQ